MWTKQSRKLDERVAAEVQKALRARAEALGHDLAEGIREYLGQSADAVEGYFSDLRDVLWELGAGVDPAADDVASAGERLHDIRAGIDELVDTTRGLRSGSR